MRRTPPMPAEQRPRPNTTVTNSSGQGWESKALHGKYLQRRVKPADVDQDKTHRWLKAAGLKAETEGFIIATQEQSPQHAGINKTSSRSLTWTQNVDCMAVSTRPLTTWSLAALNWLKLNIPAATTRQLHPCTGRSAKSFAL
ncbi:unnamed protein product, partial [Porites evermanni]